MPLRSCVIIVCTAILLAPIAMAQEKTKWHTVAEGSRVSAVFGVPGDAESIELRATCEKPGAPIQFWYLSDQAILPRQSTRRDGTRTEVTGFKVSIQVDNIAHQYIGRAQPEEMYGGNEVAWSTPARDALFEDLLRGRSIVLVVAGKKEKSITLKGALVHFKRVQERCA